MPDKIQGLGAASLWQRFLSSVGLGGNKAAVKRVNPATDGYQPVRKGADPLDPQGMVMNGASRVAPKSGAVVTPEAALEKVLAHLREHRGAFHAVAQHVYDKSAAELRASVFFKDLHDFDGQYLVMLNTFGIVSTTLEFTIDQKTGQFSSIYDLDLFGRRIGHNRAPVY